MITTIVPAEIHQLFQIIKSFRNRFNLFFQIKKTYDETKVLEELNIFCKIALASWDIYE